MCINLNIVKKLRNSSKIRRDIGFQKCFKSIFGKKHENDLHFRDHS